jgi:three-Cys-motif partner protein
MQHNMSNISHDFGNISAWTKDKLDRVEEYLNQYLVALKNQRFQLEYIDAFAGTGYVTKEFTVGAQSLFELEETVSLRDFIDGSARIALQTNPTFSKYTFIERHLRRSKELLKLKEEFPHLANSIEVVNGDANTHVQQICRNDWISNHRRAVMFLDPYGTQVTWETIEAIANTKAIDLWLLFPIGTVNRLLNKNGQIIESRVSRLNKLFGDEQWYKAFFEEHEKVTLFGNETSEMIKIASFDKIAEYFVNRLRHVFADVASNPLFLRNSMNSPIFLLCFAAGNPKGAPIAVRIAQSILSKK